MINPSELGIDQYWCIGNIDIGEANVHIIFLTIAYDHFMDDIVRRLGYIDVYIIDSVKTTSM